MGTRNCEVLGEQNGKVLVEITSTEQGIGPYSEQKENTQVVELSPTEARAFASRVEDAARKAENNTQNNDKQSRSNNKGVKTEGQRW